MLLDISYSLIFIKECWDMALADMLMAQGWSNMDYKSGRNPDQSRDSWLYVMQRGR